jgi:hypothetical protein
MRVSIRPRHRLVVLVLLAGLALGAPATAGAGWTRVISDGFDVGGVPSHWREYDGRYRSGVRNCASPSHVYAWQGALHLLMHYEPLGLCGPGWYTGGAQLARAYGSVDQRVTLRWRIASSGRSSHHVIPMRFPETGAWPAAGEEDYCEGAGLGDCATFLHYGAIAPGRQVLHTYDLGFGMGEWHTMRFQRRDHVVTAWVDDMATPAWVYRGSATTLPDTIKRVVLQQECRATGCPAGTSGWQEIQIDWIRVANPS